MQALHAKYYDTIDDIGNSHVRNPRAIPTATWRLLKVLILMSPLCELDGDGCIVEEPKFPDDGVKVFVKVGRLESEWVGARATPAMPESVRLGGDFGGVSMMAGKLVPAALIAANKRSLASEGIVDTSPMRGGSTEGFVRLP